MIEEIIHRNAEQNILLYGLGTETERFISAYGKNISVVGLLDGFRSDGEMYGYPIIPIEEAVEKNVRLIIVVARPGSCKAIVKRIGAFCRDNGIALFDVRGRDLLVEKQTAYDFRVVRAGTKKKLCELIDKAEVVSFDLLDTLIMRKVMCYTDVFELLEGRLKERGICIPEFTKMRLAAEKECANNGAPTLEKIYKRVLDNLSECCDDLDSFGVDAMELAAAEWEIDRSLMIPRSSMCEIFTKTASKGKKVFITTDNYYTKDQIASLLEEYGLDGYDDLIVSCECGTSKTQELFGVLVSDSGVESERILHIGDDEKADVECAERNGIRTFGIYSAAGLFDVLGGLGMEDTCESLADRVKCGLFLARIFNDPFVFEDADSRLAVSSADDIGYLFCGPMISDFTVWMKERIASDGIEGILFGARDGYLLEKLYKTIDSRTDSCYFLTSRTAAIRAGMEDVDDIAYVDSMKFSGTDEEALKIRFGIDVSKIGDGRNRDDAILARSFHLRSNYCKYVEKLGIGDKTIAMFDFVAKGTTQLYLQKILDRKMKGYYFLQLEPEFMADRGLDIVPFYNEEEKNTSVIYECYYILETLLTAPYPQLLEFDDDGEPVYANETRSEKDISCFMRAQDGIAEFFKDYISILPDSLRSCNRKLDEKMLALLGHVRIDDEDFNSLTVEDPFFGRMTDIRDVIAL